MFNRAVRCAAIGVLLALCALPGHSTPPTFKVLHIFPIEDGAFACTLSEVRPGVFVGSYSTSSDEIFQITSAGTFSVLAALKPAVEGNGLEGPLFPGSDGYLYGSTTNYGTNPENLGVVFRMGGNGALSVVSNQIGLSSPVIEGADGNLYGTGLNAASSFGLYKVSRAGSLLDFDIFQTSASPITVLDTGPVTQASDGNFYGEAWYSETPYIFKVTPAGSFSMLYEGTDLYYPAGGLAEGPNGVLYGANIGSIFSVNSSGKFHTIYNFGDDSALPAAGLTVASDGNLYGIESWLYGGFGNGEPGIFRLAPDGSGYTIVYSFGSQYAGLEEPGPALVQGSDGKLYGALDTGVYALLFSLDLGLPGPRPFASLFQPVEGAPGTQVRIAGQHLIEASGVEFNGKPATTFQNDGPNFVTATVPAGATSGPISVTTANGRGTTASSFSVQ